MRIIGPDHIPETAGAKGQFRSKDSAILRNEAGWQNLQDELSSLADKLETEINGAIDIVAKQGTEMKETASKMLATSEPSGARAQRPPPRPRQG